MPPLSAKHWEPTMTIAVFGSINVDITAYAERLPRPGETVHGTSYLTGLGGKGANQAAAAARLGAQVAMIGRIGSDGFGELAQRALLGFGVTLADVLVDKDSATGIAIIGVDAGGENVITVIAGANHAVSHSDCQTAAAALDTARVLLLQLEVPIAASMAAAARVRAAGGLIVLDPAPAPAGGLPADLVAAVDVLTPNETETAALTGSAPRTLRDGLEAAKALRARGLKAAIVKLGAQGVALSGPDGEHIIPAYRVKAIDTVAAGDCFNGGLAFALAQGQPMAHAVRFAAACGALATTKRGAADAAPTLMDVQHLMQAQNDA
jgi:ribokinase